MSALFFTTEDTDKILGRRVLCEVASVSSVVNDTHAD
jgi:hypothetical protein